MILIYLYLQVLHVCYSNNYFSIDHVNTSLKTPDDIDHYCQEMATATFEATDTDQAQDILDFCINQVMVKIYNNIKLY